MHGAKKTVTCKDLDNVSLTATLVHVNKVVHVLNTN